MIYWPDWMDGFLDALLDVPQNVAQCGIPCAYTDVMAYILWALNGYQTLNCANQIYTFLMGSCQ